MRAIHWLRSRQESRKLAYWLSLVAYDRGDRSLSNRIYLLKGEHNGVPVSQSFRGRDQIFVPITIVEGILKLAE